MPRIINRLYVARRPINIGYAKHSLVPVRLILRIREILQHTETFAERNLLLDREPLTAKNEQAMLTKRGGYRIEYIFFQRPRKIHAGYLRADALGVG